MRESPVHFFRKFESKQTGKYVGETLPAIKTGHEEISEGGARRQTAMCNRPSRDS